MTDCRARRQTPIAANLNYVKSPGRYVPEVIAAASGNDKAAESEMVKLPLTMSISAPASDQNSKAAPFRPTRRKSRSSGKVWDKPPRVIFMSMTLDQARIPKLSVSETV